jgi:CubicO group peptidase (beta-lactamase class C family)
MDSRFQAVCAGAAAAWDVGALAVGTSVAGTVEALGIGCTPETRFRIASVTKPFTAMLALDLLDLDAPTGVWPDDVRVAHLLAHTSGFDCENGDLARFGEDEGALAAAVAELADVQRWVGVDQVWSYANTGYWLAASLCAEAAGTTYEEALAERVLRPAGLAATAFDEPELAATGRDALDGSYPRARRPSGGLVSNVDDLLRFGAHHLAHPSSARMRTVRGRPTGGVYGLGLWGERVGGIEVWGHGGSYGGFQSSFLTVPTRDAVFVGLTNASLGSKALREIEDAFFEHLLGSARRVPETVDLPPFARDAVTGSYTNGEATYDVGAAASGVTVTMDGEVLAARPIGDRTFEIVEGDHVRERFDFPLPGFGRFGSRLAERVA